MRKTLLGFMAVLMHTPILVCAMAFCPMQSAQAADPAPCHQSNNDGFMFVLDCMGVDLLQQGISNDIQPEQSADSVDYTWADLVLDYRPHSYSTNGVRGPPDRAERVQSEPSIILTTQRLRI